MGFFIQIIALVIIGIFLLWFGYSIFLGSLSSFRKSWFSFKDWKKRDDKNKGEPGDPQVCPLCSMKLVKGELIKTIAFPSVTGGIDRLMFIRGCYSCLNNDLPRYCPICGISLDVNDYLVSRMFERANRNNHVHVLGCNHCKNMGTLKR